MKSEIEIEMKKSLNRMPHSCALITIGALSALMFAAGCGGDGGATRRPIAARVTCGSAPAEALARVVLGAAVPYLCPGRVDNTLAHGAPSREDLAALRDGRVILLAGAGLEDWAGGASLPPSRVLDAARGSEERWIELPVMRHTHGGGEEHSHAGHDPHLWLDPALLGHQLRRIHDAALAAFPEQRAALEARWPAVEAGRARFASRIAALAPRLEGRALLGAWPAYGYLGRALGVPVRALPFDAFAPDGGPRTLALHGVERFAAESAGVLLWPTPPPAELAQHIHATTGVISVHFEAFLRPLAAEVDPLDALHTSLDRLEAALSERGR